MLLIPTFSTGGGSWGRLRRLSSAAATPIQKFETVDIPVEKLEPLQRIVRVLQESNSSIIGSYTLNLLNGYESDDIDIYSEDAGVLKIRLINNGCSQTNVENFYDCDGIRVDTSISGGIYESVPCSPGDMQCILSRSPTCLQNYFDGHTMHAARLSDAMARRCVYLDQPESFLVKHRARGLNMIPDLPEHAMRPGTLLLSPLDDHMQQRLRAAVSAHADLHGDHLLGYTYDGHLLHVDIVLPDAHEHMLACSDRCREINPKDIIATIPFTGNVAKLPVAEKTVIVDAEDTRFDAASVVSWFNEFVLQRDMRVGNVARDMMPRSRLCGPGVARIIQKYLAAIGEAHLLPTPEACTIADLSNFPVYSRSTPNDTSTHASSYDCKASKTLNNVVDIKHASRRLREQGENFHVLTESGPSLQEVDEEEIHEQLLVWIHNLPSRVHCDPYIQELPSSTILAGYKNDDERYCSFNTSFVPARGALQPTQIQCKDVETFLRSFSACMAGEIDCLTKAKLFVDNDETCVPPACDISDAKGKCPLPPRHFPQIFIITTTAVVLTTILASFISRFSLTIAMTSR